MNIAYFNNIPEGFPGNKLIMPRPPAVKTAAAADKVSIHPGTGSRSDAPIMEGRTILNGS